MTEQDIHVSPADREILRPLAEDYAVAAADPVNRTRRKLWQRLNDNDQERPMVWINEIPWHELNDTGELELLCSGSLARTWESRLRRIIYQWRHMAADMIVEPWFECTKLWSGGLLSLDVQEKTIGHNSGEGIKSHQFEAQIQDEKDVERLVRLEPAEYDAPGSELLLQTASHVFEGILPVKLRGVRHIWFTTWDNLIRVWGVQAAMMDLVLKPDLVNLAVSTYVAQAMNVLDSFERQGLLSTGTSAVRVGSGGYGNMLGCGEVDSKECGCISTKDLWGCSNAQIFSDVSPEMHYEFAIRHEIPWLQRWAFNYYGCCEALHLKHAQLEAIPNLRKISISPWANVDTAIHHMGKRYVYSWKPNPAVFVDSAWNPDRVRQDIRQMIGKTMEAGISLEIIMKDISTVLDSHAGS